jgi:hypothetical protein
MKRAWLRRAGRAALFCGWFALAGCGEDGQGPKTCDAACRDRSAARALRETLKLVYNLTLQGNAVGEQDERTACPLGGTARVRGTASSVPEQGATEVALSYELRACAYVQRDDDAEESYDTVIDGTVLQSGIIAIQPSATTALRMEAEAIRISGTVYDPPEVYAEPECALLLNQSGNHLGGTWCGRGVALSL